jgi:hypothetical protein
MDSIPVRDEETHRLLREILHAVRKGRHQMGDALAELKAAVEEATTVDQSILSLVDQLASKIEALPAQGADTVPASDVLMLATQLRTASQQILAKVRANTPPQTPSTGDAPTDPASGVEGSAAGTPTAEDGTPAP